MAFRVKQFLRTGRYRVSKSSLIVALRDRVRCRRQVGLDERIDLGTRRHRHLRPELRRRECGGDVGEGNGIGRMATSGQGDGDSMSS